MKLNLVFITTSIGDEAVFTELSKRAQVTVAYLGVDAPKNIGYTAISLLVEKRSLFSKTLRGLDTLQKALEHQSLVIIPHTALPRPINKLLKKYTTPDSLFVWSDFTPDYYQKSKLKQSIRNTGFFLRALKSNHIIASSFETKRALTGMGFPQSGQKMSIIPHAVSLSKKSTIRPKTFTVGYFVDYSHPDEMNEVLRAIGYYKKKTISFKIFTSDTKIAAILRTNVTSDDRISIVLTSENTDEEKYLNEVSALLIPSRDTRYETLVREAAISGIPSMCTQELPGASLNRPFKKAAYMPQLSAIYLTKVIVEMHSLYLKNKSWNKRVATMQKRAENSSVKQCVVRWETLLGI